MTQHEQMEKFQHQLTPLAKELAQLSLTNPDETRKFLSENLALDSKLISQIRTSAFQGEKQGWLLPRENAGLRFGRIAKNLSGFSVDAVLMKGPGPKHRHANGEIDLCFTVSGTPQFDGHPEGWVVYPPESVHIPTVSNGEMLILYFLPEGAIEFL